MFGKWKKRSAPNPCPANPGIGTETKNSFTDGRRNWTEVIKLPELIAKVFKEHGHKVTNEGTWLRHLESDYQILPQFVEMIPVNGSVRTVTTIQTNHPSLIPNGVFEYQHAAAENVETAVLNGFDQWVQTDFVALCDAVQSKPMTCTLLEMEISSREGRPSRFRRAILGPVAHLMQSPAGVGSEDHPFCPSCLLTRSFEAFKELFEGDSFYGLRLYAARDATGTPQADCRVNGEDWGKGAQALREYVKTWPEAGFEFRKQYVILQNRVID
jgi:hypothetical protein